MKTEEFKKMWIEQWLNKVVNDYEDPVSWEWNKDGSVDVEGSVNITDYPYSVLPVKFRNVSKHFECDGLKLTSLYGIPDTVGSYISLINNPGKFTEEEIKKICKVGTGICV